MFSKDRIRYWLLHKAEKAENRALEYEVESLSDPVLPMVPLDNIIDIPPLWMAKLNSWWADQLRRQAIKLAT